MTRCIQAIYQNGVLRPLEPVSLSENDRVTLIIDNGTHAPVEEEWLDQDLLAACALEADPSVSLEAVREALAKIPGSLTDDFIAERDER